MSYLSTIISTSGTGSASICEDMMLSETPLDSSRCGTAGGLNSADFFRCPPAGMPPPDADDEDFVPPDDVPPVPLPELPESQAGMKRRNMSTAKTKMF